MHEISAYNYLMANLHFSMEGMDDDPIHVRPELPDPPPPDDFSASDQVLINAAKQSKPVPSPADIRHVLSNKSKIFAKPCNQGILKQNGFHISVSMKRLADLLISAVDASYGHSHSHSCCMWYETWYPGPGTLVSGTLYDT